MEITAEFEFPAVFDAGLRPIVRVMEKDHTKLSHRDAPDQHPMEAITELNDTLNAKLSASQALSNQEIEALMR